MIAQDQINKLITQYQTSDINVLREYYQHLFLSYFFQQTQTNNIFFKGGTALKILYKSPRFSEDLDFSANLSNKEEVEQVLIQTLDQIEKEGTSTDYAEATSTSGGYRATLFFQKEPTVKIDLEISLRQGEKEGELITVQSDFIPTYTVFALLQDQLVDEKIQALLARKKPRDFYDLYFILRANLLPAQKKSVLPQTFNALKDSDINFEKELKEFLPRSHWAIIRDFKSTLEREINRFRGSIANSHRKVLRRG